MNKREAFRKALTETTHRKHMRKSGKRWLVRGVTALTIGLMLAQPVIGVAAAVESVQPTEEVVKEETPAQGPVATDPVEETQTETPAETPVTQPDTTTTQNQTTQSTQSTANGTQSMTNGTQSTGTTTSASSTQTQARAPQAAAATTKVVEERRDKVTGVEVKTTTLTYGDEGKLNVEVKRDRQQSLHVVMNASVFRFANAQGQKLTYGQLRPGQAYKIHITSDTINALKQYGQVDVREGATKNSLTLNKKEITAALPKTEIKVGESLTPTITGVIHQDNVQIETLINGKVVNIKDLKAGTYQVTFAFKSGNNQNGHYKLKSTPQTLTVKALKLGIAVGGMTRQYDGTNNLPANFIRPLYDLDLPLSLRNSDYRYNQGNGNWTDGTPKAVGKYQVEVRKDAKNAIQRQVEAKYGKKLDDAMFSGTYEITPKAGFEKLSVKVGGEKEFDGTANLPAGTFVTSPGWNFGGPRNEADYEYRAKNARANWTPGTPTGIGEYEIRVKEGLQKSIQDKILKHYGQKLPDSVFEGDYTIKRALVLEMSIGGSKNFDNTVNLPAGFVQQSADLDINFGLTNRDYQYRGADGRVHNGTPKKVGKYSIWINDSKVKTIQAAVKAKYNRYLAPDSFKGNYEIKVAPGFNDLNLSVGGSKLFDGKSTLPDHIFTAGANWTFGQPTSEAQYEYRAKGKDKWLAGAPVQVGRYEIRVAPKTRDDMQKKIYAQFGKQLSEKAFQGDYTIRERNISLAIDGEKTFDGSRDLPVNIIGYLGDWQEGFNLNLSNRDFQYLPAGSNNWIDGTPKNVGVYQLRVNPRKQVDLQREILATHGKTLKASDFEGRYEILATDAFADISFAVSGTKVYDKTSAMPRGGIVQTTGEFPGNLNFKQKDFEYRSPGKAGWISGLPTEVGVYEVQVKKDRRDDLQRELMKKFGQSLNEDSYRGMYTITPSPKLDALKLMLSGEKQYDQTNALPASGIHTTEGEWPMALRFKVGDFRYRSKKNQQWKNGLPSEVGKYVIELTAAKQKEIQRAVKAEYGATLPAAMFTGDYTITPHADFVGLGLTIDGSKEFDKTTDMPAGGIWTLAGNWRVPVNLTADDFQYQTAKNKWVNGLPSQVGQYTVRVKDGAKRTIQAAIKREYGKQLDDQMFTGRYQITPSADLANVSLTIDGSKVFDKTSKLPEGGIWETSENWPFDLSGLTASDFQYRTRRGWKSGLPTQVGKYTVRLNDAAKRTIQAAIKAEFGGTISDRQFVGAYEITPRAELTDLSLGIGGIKEYDQTNELPDDGIWQTEDWLFDPALSAEDFDFYTSDGELLDEAPTDVGEYRAELKPARVRQLQREIKAEYGAYAENLDTSGDYTIIPNSKLDGLSLLIDMEKQFDGTADYDGQRLQQIGDWDITINPPNKAYQHQNADGEWVDGLPIEVGEYAVRLRPWRVNYIQNRIEAAYGARIDESNFEGTYRITPQRVADPYFILPTFKYFDGTDELPDDIEQALDLDDPLCKNCLMYMPIEDASEMARGRSLARAEFTMGTPTQPGTYLLAVRSDIEAQLEDMYPDTDMTDMYSTTYTIAYRDDGGNSGGDNGSGGSGTSTTPGTGGGTTTGTGAGSTTGATITPLAWQPTGSTGGMSQLSSGSGSYGMLPSTGARQQSLLALLGMTVLGSLALAGWYTKRKAD